MNLCLQSGGGWWEVSLRRLRIYLSIEHILTELILGTMTVFMVTMIIMMTVYVCMWQVESVMCFVYLILATLGKAQFYLALDFVKNKFSRRSDICTDFHWFQKPRRNIITNQVPSPPMRCDSSK